MTRRIWAGLIGLGVAAAAASTAAAGPVWDECVRPDAGSLRPGAQDTTSLLTMTRIRGCLRGNTTRGPGDYEDMFIVNITNPGGFYATTGAPDGSATFDTQIFLFLKDGPVDGAGVLVNDDISLLDTASYIAAPDAEGYFPTLPGPGLYYLAITASNNDPTAGGLAIFDQTPATQISGPDGPGGDPDGPLGPLLSAPIDGWTGPTDPLAFGTYEIGGLIPEPSTLALFALGGLIVTRRR